MTKYWFVKIKEFQGSNPPETVAVFSEASDAERYKSKLINGCAGRFGTVYDVWVDPVTNKDSQNDS